jgi:hypothetical protein
MIQIKRGVFQLENRRGGRPTLHAGRSVYPVNDSRCPASLSGCEKNGE